MMRIITMLGTCSFPSCMRSFQTASCTSETCSHGSRFWTIVKDEPHTAEICDFAWLNHGEHAGYKTKATSYSSHCTGLRGSSNGWYLNWPRQLSNALVCYVHQEGPKILMKVIISFGQVIEVLKRVDVTWNPEARKRKRRERKTRLSMI